MSKNRFIISGVVLFVALAMASCCVTGFCPVDFPDSSKNEIQTKTYKTDQ